MSPNKPFFVHNERARLLILHPIDFPFHLDTVIGRPNEQHTITEREQRYWRHVINIIGVSGCNKIHYAIKP